MEPSLINDFKNTILEDLAIADNNQYYSQDYQIHCKSTFINDSIHKIIITYARDLINNVNDKEQLLTKRTGVELGMIYNGQMCGLLPAFYFQQIQWLRRVLIVIENMSFKMDSNPPNKSKS